MKFTPILTLLFLEAMVLLSCGSPDQQADTDQNTNFPEMETIVEQPDTILFWTVNIEQKEKTRVYEDTTGINNPQSIINGINTIYPGIQLEFVKRSGDTVYTHIDSAFNFTNDMGSFGAAEYIATVVVNLTTLAGVNYVDLDFPVGSHATPGVYSKSSYEAYKEMHD